MRQLLRLLEETPSVQARLREDFVNERVLLQEAIATRLGRPAEGLFCQMTARLAASVLEILGAGPATARDLDNATAAEQAAAQLGSLLKSLNREPPALPEVK